MLFSGGEPMNTSISKNIKRLRQQTGMTQEQMAEKLFVTRQTVSLWENGKTQPDIQTLERIAECFGVELMTVLYGNSLPKSEEEQRKEALIRWLVIVIAVYAGFIALDLCLFLFPPIWRITDTWIFSPQLFIRRRLIPFFLTERGVRLWQIRPIKLWPTGWKLWAWRVIKLFCIGYLAAYWLNMLRIIDLSNVVLLAVIQVFVPWIFLCMGYCIGNEVSKGWQKICNVCRK